METHVLASDRHENVAGINQIMGSRPPFDNWISNDNTYISNYITRIVFSS